MKRFVLDDIPEFETLNETEKKIYEDHNEFEQKAIDDMLNTYYSPKEANRIKINSLFWFETEYLGAFDRHIQTSIQFEEDVLTVRMLRNKNKQ